LKQGRHVKIGIQSRPVQAKAGWAHFDLRELGRRGPGQAFGEVRWEGYLDSGIQADDDSGGSTIVPCRHGVARVRSRSNSRLGFLKLTFSNGLVRTRTLSQ
jgi:hypothetical protein